MVWTVLITLNFNCQFSLPSSELWTWGQGLRRNFSQILPVIPYSFQNKSWSPHTTCRTLPSCRPTPWHHLLYLFLHPFTAHSLPGLLAFPGVQCNRQAHSPPVPVQWSPSRMLLPSQIVSGSGVTFMLSHHHYPWWYFVNGIPFHVPVSFFSIALSRF